MLFCSHEEFCGWMVVTAAQWTVVTEALCTHMHAGKRLRWETMLCVLTKLKKVILLNYPQHVFFIYIFRLSQCITKEKTCLRRNEKVESDCNVQGAQAQERTGPSTQASLVFRI